MVLHEPLNITQQIWSNRFNESVKPLATKYLKAFPIESLPLYMARTEHKIYSITARKARPINKIRCGEKNECSEGYFDINANKLSGCFCFRAVVRNSRYFQCHLTLNTTTHNIITISHQKLLMRHAGESTKIHYLSHETEKLKIEKPKSVSTTFRFRCFWFVVAGCCLFQEHETPQHLFLWRQINQMVLIWLLKINELSSGRDKLHSISCRLSPKFRS